MDSNSMEWFKFKRLNKRGMALPFVMIFMVVSHLVYMGLIRLNQLNQVHYQLVQQHYVSQVQATMAQSLAKMDPKAFEHFINPQLEKILSERIGTAAEWISEPSFKAGVVKIDDFIIVFEQKIIAEIPFNQQESELFRQAIEQQGWELIEQQQDTADGSWNIQWLEQHHAFNTGEVSLTNEHIKSQIHKVDEFFTMPIFAKKMPYKIEWRSFIYQPPLDSGAP